MPLAHSHPDPPRRSVTGRVLRALLVLILLLAVSVAAALVAIFQFEQATLEPLLETLVKRATGRTITIVGLDAQAGRVIGVRAGRVALGNADWGSREQLLTLEDVQLSVDPGRLLDGFVVIDAIRVGGGELLFEQDEQGRSNWAMGGAGQRNGPDERLAAIPLLIERAALSDLTITVVNTALMHPLSVRLDSVTQQAGARDRLDAEVRGSIEGRAVELRATAEPFSQLLAARAVSFRIGASLAALRLLAEGEIDDLLAPRRPTIRLTATAPEVAEVAELLALPPSVTGELRLDARMVRVLDHHEITVDGAVGPFNLDARGRLRSLGTMEDAALRLSANGPDLAAAAGFSGVQGLPAQPFELESSLQITDGRLRIDELRFDTGDNHLRASGVLNQFPELVNAEVRVELRGGNYLEFAELLGLAGRPLEPAPYALQGDLTYGVDGKQSFSAQATLGAIRGEFRGRLSASPDLAGSRLDYFVTGPDSAEILRALGRPAALRGSYVLKGGVDRTDAGVRVDAATLSVAENELVVTGTIGNEPLRGDTDLTARFTGPDLAKIAGVVGYTGFVPAGDAEITLRARADREGVHVDSLAAQVGRSRLRATGLIGTGAALAGTRLSVSAQGERVGDVLPPELVPYIGAQHPYDVAARLEARSGEVAFDSLIVKLGDVRLDAAGRLAMRRPPDGSQMSVAVHGPDLAAIVPERWQTTYDFPRAAFSVSGDVALRGNALTLKDVAAAVGPDRLAVTGTVPLAAPFDGLALSVAADGPDLAALVPPELSHLGIEAAPYRVAADVSLASDVLSIERLEASLAQADLRGGLGVSLQDPRAFGRFDLAGRGASLEALVPTLPGYRPPPLAFDLVARGGWETGRVTIDDAWLALDQTRVEVSGEIDLPPGMTATRLKLSGRGERLSDLGEIAGRALPQTPFDVKASLTGTADSLILPALDVRLGESDVKGSLTVELDGKPRIELALASDLLDLASLLALADDATADDSPPAPAAADRRVIPNLPVPAQLLHLADISAHADVGELRLPRNTFNNLRIDATLLDGDLRVRQLRASAVQGELGGTFRVTATGERIAADGTLQGTGIRLGKPGKTAADAAFPKQDLRLDFVTAGATTRQLAASLNGHVEVTGGTGRVQNSARLLVGDFVSELLRTVNPFAKSEPYTTVSCSALYADIVNGLIKINPGAVVQTDKLNVFIDGQVDLGSEQINLRFNTAARTGLGVSVADFVNPFVGVGGTFANPGLGLNRDRSIVLEGGVAYATGGASIIAKGLFDRWFGEKDPCGKLALAAQKKAGPAANPQ